MHLNAIGKFKLKINIHIVRRKRTETADINYCNIDTAIFHLTSPGNEHLRCAKGELTDKSKRYFG